MYFIAVKKKKKKHINLVGANVFFLLFLNGFKEGATTIILSFPVKIDKIITVSRSRRPWRSLPLVRISITRFLYEKYITKPNFQKKKKNKKWK